MSDERTVEQITAERAQELIDRIARIEADIEHFDGDRRGHWHALDEAKERLADSAPDLARTVIAQAEEIARLRADLAKAVGALALQSDYVSLREMGGDLDRHYEHLDSCAIRAAELTRATLSEITHD